MTDSYVKDIVYDLIESKLKIKELEDKLLKLERENSELTLTNAELKTEVDKWKSQIVSYINDYRNIYTNKEEITVEPEKESVNIVVNTDNDEVTDNKSTENNKKTRSEYMKEYMKNKRKKEKEELKQIIINKK
jgi:predicted RNase H-like nuclease